VEAIKPVKRRRGKQLSPVVEALKTLDGKGYVNHEDNDTWTITEDGIAYIKEHPMKKEEAYESTI